MKFQKKQFVCFKKNEGDVALTISKTTFILRTGQGLAFIKENMAI